MNNLEKYNELKAFKSQLSTTDYGILDRAISFGRVTFVGVLKWEDMDKQQLVLEVPNETVIRLFTPILTSTDPQSRVTCPLYPSKKNPSAYRVRLNMKKFTDWPWKNQDNGKGVYEVVADVDVYVGYTVGEKQLSGWYLRPILITRTY